MQFHTTSSTGDRQPIRNSLPHGLHPSESRRSSYSGGKARRDDESGDPNSGPAKFGPSDPTKFGPSDKSGTFGDTKIGPLCLGLSTCRLQCRGKDSTEGQGKAQG